VDFQSYVVELVKIVICRGECDVSWLNLSGDYDGILRVREWVFVFSVGDHRMISFWVLNSNGDAVG
jgi:urocanate hydratase